MKYKECSKDYMIHLFNEEKGYNAPIDIEIEKDCIAHVLTENYLFHVCNWGVMTADRIGDHKPYDPHASYKCTDHTFNMLFNAIVSKVI